MKGGGRGWGGGRCCEQVKVEIKNFVWLITFQFLKLFWKTKCSIFY